jgi:hypothetical protein
MTRCDRSTVALISAVGLLAVSACGSSTEAPRIQDSPTENSVISLTPSSVNPHPSTLEELVAYIANAGLAVPNPRDVTQRDCPAIDCTSKVETDTVAIMTFSTPGKAMLYAGSTSDVFQITTVVMSFPASMPTDQRRAYAAAVRRVVE